MTTYLEWRERQWYIATMDKGFSWSESFKRKRDAIQEVMNRSDSVNLRIKRKEHGIYQVNAIGSWVTNHEFYVAPGYRLLDAGFSPKESRD